MSADFRNANDDSEEIMKMLDHFLYAVPDVAKALKDKYAEFDAKTKDGMKYDRDEMLKDGLKRLGETLGYIIRDSGQSGLIQRLLVKKASEYLPELITEMLLGSKR